MVSEWCDSTLSSMKFWEKLGLYLGAISLCLDELFLQFFFQVEKANVYKRPNSLVVNNSFLTWVTPVFGVFSLVITTLIFPYIHHCMLVFLSSSCHKSCFSCSGLRPFVSLLGVAETFQGIMIFRQWAVVRMMLLWEGLAFAKSLAEYKTCWCVIYRHQAEGKSDALRDAWEKCLREQDVPKSHYWNCCFISGVLLSLPQNKPYVSPKPVISPCWVTAQDGLGWGGKGSWRFFLAQTGTDLKFKPLSSYWCNFALSWLGGFEASGSNGVPTTPGKFPSEF